MRMYTRNALVALGKFLKEGVKDQDIDSWLESYEADLKEWNTLPSAHQIEDSVFINFNMKPETRQVGEIIAVHFHPGKVRYDIQIETYELPDETGQKEQYYTRLYNVDGAFVASE